jgi:hypothetical protein
VRLRTQVTRKDCVDAGGGNDEDCENDKTTARLIPAARQSPFTIAPASPASWICS